MVSWVLALFALGLPAHSVVEIVVRAFYAMHDTKTPVAIGVGAMALNVGLSLALIQAFGAMGWPRFGGLALSNSLATTVEMVVLLVIIRHRLHGLEGQRMASSLARIGLSTLVMAVVAGVLAWILGGASAWLRTGLAVVAGAAVYAGVSVALGSREPRAVWGMVRSGRRTRGQVQPHRTQKKPGGGAVPPPG
jgi:putative peptidoglycan lipid II flippase